MTTKRSKKAPTDHSPKVRDALSRIERAGLGKQALAVLAAFPARTRAAALEEVVTRCGFHGMFVAAASETPRAAEERESLRHVIESADSLADACRCLPALTRARMNMGDDGIDPHDVAATAEQLSERARHALRAVPRDVGGQPKKANLEGTVFALAVVWAKYCPGINPVSKSASRAAFGGDEYTGPGLDMACRLLKLEGIRFASTNAVGAVMRKHWAKAKARAVREMAEQKAHDELDANFLPTPLAKVLSR